jgi:hypothetical protein
MASSDREFYEGPKFTPESYQPPRQHGCFFYGCIIASVMAVLLMVAVGTGFYFLYRTLGRLVEEYTATASRELPTVEMQPEQRQTLKERVEGFRKAIDAGTPTEPLVLTGDDLNALIEENPDLKGRIYVAVEGDKLKGQVSIPLESLGLPMFRGRYLNGEADLKASLINGVPLVTLESIEVNGKPLPEGLMSQLRQQNLAKDAYKNPKDAEQIRKLESLEIKDGKIVITVRAKDATTAPGAADSLNDLPADVLAPPNASRPEAAPPKTESPKTIPAKAEAPAETP